ncbi:pseudouridine synthase [Bacillus safensis FO-36b] [Bacillus safensis subsp. safensis]
MGREKQSIFNGQLLHAGVLGFDHPRTGEYIEFTAPIPADMQALLIH